MGLSNLDICQANLFIGPFMHTQGKVFNVKPRTGLDGNKGRSITHSLKTALKAQQLATANQNDVVYLYAEGNASGNVAGTYWCTDYLSATLDWAKDHVHLIGVNAGPRISHRSRIAFASTYDTASNLFTVSADGCRFENIGFYAGVAGTLPTGCLKVTGDRNVFVNCHIAGIGHDNNDIADAYSLYLSGSENLFKGCTIGLDTITRGTADNAEIIMGGSLTGPILATRNVFEDCLILTWAGANTHHFLRRGSAGHDRMLLFRNCLFLNVGTNAAGGATMLEALAVTAGGHSPYIILDNCSYVGALNWETAAGISGIVYTSGRVPVATTGSGLMLPVTGA
ncbi:MAG: hypothetical protein V1790_17610 [Planctomycetota bacterium]